VLKRLKTALEALRKPRSLSLEASPDGFAIIGDKPDRSLDWSGVSSVHAYKRDLITTDLICLGIESDQGVWEVHEGMDGYEQFLEHFHAQLDVSPEWVLNVMLPAFETNLTQIYPVQASEGD